MAYEKACSTKIADLEVELMQRFTCPSCYQYIKCPPIQQCMVGHIYCSSCFKLLSRCWLCAAPKADIKCTLLESLQSLLNFPCKGYRKGCRFTGKSSVIKDHEKACQYTTVGCPARRAGCTWTGNVSEILPHLTKEHPENISDTPEQKMTWNRGMERNRMHAHLFSAYGRLFRLSWMMDDTGSLRFGLFRLGGAAGNTYKIIVTHATRSACTMTYIEPVRCLTDGGREEDWNDLWTNLDPWCWRKYCDDEGNLHLSVTIGKLHSN